MNAPVNARTFKSGNSEAVRLPKGLGFGIGVDLQIERDGEKVVLTPVRNEVAKRQDWLKLLDDLEAIGRPSGLRQEREPFEFPERKGL